MGEMTVANSTISGNQANYGGGIMGEMTVANSTISGNQANFGGGIWIFSLAMSTWRTRSSPATPIRAVTPTTSVAARGSSSLPAHTT